MKKKIIISIMPHLKGGGVEKVVSVLSEGLNKFEDCDVHIITIKPFENLIPLSKEIKVHALDTNLRNLFKQRVSNKTKFQLIADYIKTNITADEPDLVLCHQETVSKIMQYCSYKNVYHVVHSNLTNDRLSNAKGIKRFLRVRKIHRLYRNLNVICVSKGVEDDLKETFGLSNTRVIYNAISLRQLEKSASEPLSLPEKPYFINVGNFSAAKRQDRLVEAYLKSGIQDIDLVLLGEHTERIAKIESLLKHHPKAAKRVHLPGFASNPYPWISNSCGFVLSSDYEGLPTVLLESIALGIPTISTDCKSGPREIFGSEFEQCLCPLTIEGLKEKIIEISKSPEKFHVPLREEFTLDYMCHEYYQLVINPKAS